jgi:sulfatase maturation enzyme AslB (radical SAM superfamily)
MVFIVTENCNLNCVYCYEKHKNGNTLSADFIKQKIRAEMLAENGYEELSVIFFGGEPLLEYDTIREVVDWFLSIDWPVRAKTVRFQVATNGTLLNRSIKQWFATHRNRVTLCLSMDGTKTAQDRNRCNSYDSVIRHMDFFRENWPQQPLKMTIGPESLDLVYEGVVHIHNLGLMVEPDIVFEEVWGDPDSQRMAVRVWAEQLDKLVQFYFANPQFQPPDVLRRKLLRLFGVTPDPKRTFCGAGKHTTTFAADGREFPCFRFAPVSIDRPLDDVFGGPDIENDQCATCAFEKICPTCEGHNYLVTGSSFKRTTYHCRFFQVSLLASAKLMFLEHSEDLTHPPESQSEEEQLQRMRRLLAIRVVNDLCAPVVDWASIDSEG